MGHLEDIIIRPCLASDVSAAIPLIYSTGPKTFDYIFADSALDQTPDFLSYAFQKGGSELGYQNHLGLFVEGRLVGIAAIWSHAETMVFTFYGAIQIIKHYGLRTGLKIIRRALKMEKVIKPPKKGVAYIGHLAIADQFQGRGLGVRLHQHLEQLPQSIDAGTLALDVSARNPNAQRLYERLGYQVVEVISGDLKTEYGDVIEHRYMEKALGTKRST